MMMVSEGDDDADDDDDDDDDDFETPRATQTANHTTPQGGGGIESRSNFRTTPHHTGAGLQAVPVPTIRGGGERGGGDRTGIIEKYTHTQMFSSLVRTGSGPRCSDVECLRSLS